MPDEELRSGRVYHPTDQPLSGPATTARRTSPAARGAGDRAEGDARLEYILRRAAERGQLPGGTQPIDSSKDEAAWSGRPLAGGKGNVGRAMGQATLGSTKAGEVSSTSGPVPRRPNLVQHPAGPTSASAAAEDDRRRTESFRRIEIGSLSVRIEELERQILRRTIMLACAVAFGVLSAVAAVGLAVMGHPDPPQADQAGAAAFVPEAQSNPSQAAESSNPPTPFEPSHAPPPSSAVARGASAGLADPPRATERQRPVPQTDPLPAEPPAAMTELGQPEGSRAGFGRAGWCPRGCNPPRRSGAGRSWTGRFLA